VEQRPRRAFPRARVQHDGAGELAGGGDGESQGGPADQVLDDPQRPRLDTGEYRRATGFELALAYDAPDGRAYGPVTRRPRVWYPPEVGPDPGFRPFRRPSDRAAPRPIIKTKNANPVGT